VSIAVVGSFFCLVAFTHAAQAQIIDTDLYTDITEETGLGGSQPTTVAAVLINAFLGVLAIIGIVLIVYGGFIWMTSAGNTEKVDKAKKLLISATIGLAIILASYGIALYVFTAIESATGQAAL
jgi:hypothetical protein